MPFDSMPAETKPDVFSLQGLIAWLETQDPATEYDFMNTCGCLLYRALRAGGHPVKTVGGRSWIDIRGMERALPGDEAAQQLERGWGRQVSIAHPWTYGAALNRARKLLAGARD